jgi:CHAT domain-containing protein/Tfp pilus assembly protein PilF
MSGQLLLTGLLILASATPGRAEPEELSKEQRAKLEAEARKLDRERYELFSEGKVLEAVRRCQQALAVRQKLYPPEKFPDGHDDLARTLNNMGYLLHGLGRREAALEHYQQALAMCKKLYPPEKFPDGHPHLAASLNNMGNVLASLGRPKAALAHFQQALEMNRKLYPPEKFPDGHPDLALRLNNMGVLLQRQGRPEEALQHYQQALAMYRKLYPPDRFPAGHKDLALALNNMGHMLASLGRWEAALEHSRQALDMNRNLYPPEKFPAGHPDLASSLHNMGVILLTGQQYQPAADRLAEALTVERRLIDTLAVAVSETEALAVAHSLPPSLNPYLSATLHLKESAPATYERVWIERSALSRVFSQRHQAALATAAANPEVGARFSQLRGVRAELARLLVQPLPAAREAARERDRRVNQLTDQKQHLERKLVGLLPELDKKRQLDELGPGDLRKALPAHSAFVDLRRYWCVTYDPEKPGQEGKTGAPRYVAFVVCPDRPVQRVELEGAKAINEILADWRHLIEQRKEHDSPEPARKLRRLVWDKIAAALPRETRTIFLAPDGALNRLPFAALPGGEPGTVLLEEYALAVVPHGPFLLEQLRSKRRFGEGQGVPLVLGDVRYSEPPTPLSGAVAAPGPDRDGAALNWPDLPGSARELRLLQKLAGDRAVLLSGRDADVSRLLRELPQARLAHLATHGFFNQKEFQREQQRALQQSTELLRSGTIESERVGLRISTGASNPLAYTGLVLAGANQPEKAGPYAGILPGETLLDVDLRKLELAVLSACQTGLGPVARGECVHNLQQAFHIAGCPNVVASLWSVPDDSTAALMGLFYRELLDGGKSPLEALRSAQLYLYRHPGEIKNLADRGPPLLAKGGKLPEPEPKPDPKPTDRKRAAVKDWAAFVLSGVGR